MASVDGAYVGPLELDEVGTRSSQQVRRGQEVLPEKQLARRKSVDARSAA